MSRPLTVTIPHALGAAEARRRIEANFAKLGEAIPGGMADARQTWDGDRMTFSLQAMGQMMTGWLDVLGDRVVMEVNLPGFLGMLAGKVGGAIEKQGRLLLEKR